MAGVRRLAICLALGLALGCDPADDPYAFSDGAAAPSLGEAPAPDPGVAGEKAAAPARFVLDEEDSAALDPRRSRASPREQSLILAEMDGLGSLGAAAGAAPDKASWLRRVAEDYVELASAARGQRQIADAARTAAIAVYGALLRAPFQPAYSARDEVRYYQALEYARAGKVEDARIAALRVLADTHRPIWAARARYLLGVLLAADPGKQALATSELEEAARGSDPTIARLARRRLGVRDPPREIAVAPPPPPAREVEAPPPRPAATCTMDMECEGTSVCRNGACIGMR